MSCGAGRKLGLVSGAPVGKHRWIGGVPVDQATGYHYRDDAEPGHHHSYLLPAVMKALTHSATTDRRVFDLGCGNGSFAGALTQAGYDVTGVDPSVDAVRVAQTAYPHLRLFNGSAYDDLSKTYGTFPVVTCLEVIEHVYAPRDVMRTIRSLLAPGGVLLMSTPYHGYFKNLAMALSGKLDDHFTALWDHGHIKFWSERTLRALLREASFEPIRFVRVGRIPPLAKSMLAVATRRG